jgi:hypothetical protein
LEETANEVQCYTDASIDPEASKDLPRMAGLGIFIQDMRRNNKFCIKLRIQDVTSVVMAEAAALAFAATISSKLGL